MKTSKIVLSEQYISSYSTEYAKANYTFTYNNSDDIKIQSFKNAFNNLMN